MFASCVACVWEGCVLIPCSIAAAAPRPRWCPAGLHGKKHAAMEKGKMEGGRQEKNMQNKDRKGRTESQHHHRRAAFPPPPFGVVLFSPWVAVPVRVALLPPSFLWRRGPFFPFLLVRAGCSPPPSSGCGAFPSSSFWSGDASLSICGVGLFSPPPFWWCSSPSSSPLLG